MPAHTVYVHWDFAAPLACIEWDISIRADPGESVGEYLALFSGTIDGSLCYLGLQTDVLHPDKGHGIGKGLIFSTWWSFDSSDTRISEGGFRQLGTHEGNFVGIRKPYMWTTGDYRVTLSRGQGDRSGSRELDWFDLSIQQVTTADADRRPVTPAREWIGAIRFPRRRPDTPAVIDPQWLTFLEVYSGARRWEDVTLWTVTVAASGDGNACPAGTIEYPRYPHGQSMPNANARYNSNTRRIQLSMGRGVERTDPPRRWR